MSRHVAVAQVAPNRTGDAREHDVVERSTELRPDLAHDIEIEGVTNVTWYRASPNAERGFCSTCGSHLFWKPSNEDYIGILAASVDEPSGLRMAKHIFVDNKGDYYEITDGLPQYAGYDRPLRSEKTR